MPPKYKVERDGIHDQFDKSRKKIQIFGGGFGNGKTAAAIVLKVMKVAKDYPGCNILVARSTYPKLNDTIRKEFIKWCPKDWIKAFPLGDNTCTLKNGSVVNFRYVAQQGKSGESTTSNLLSATYDLVVVDQIEDPEITEKDFLDILGRLRGNTPYVGDDPTMPRTGPRWFVVMCNPTRNWFFRKIVHPYHLFKQKDVRTPELLVDASGEPIIDLFEGPTHINAQNLGADFIATLEATYKGSMRSRFLLGEWSAYEGLVYPQFDEMRHVTDHHLIEDYYWHLRTEGYSPTILEGYDHGLAVPSAYLAGFTDQNGSVFIMDGHYEKEMTIEDHSKLIKEVRDRYEFDRSNRIWADPALFRRTAGDAKTVGKTTAAIFEDCGIRMTAGNNDITNGIAKVQQFLAWLPFRTHPLLSWGSYGTESVAGAPSIFISRKCQFLIDEFNDYYWKKTPTGDATDKPTDRNDHALDALKYMLSHTPAPAVFVKKQTLADTGVFKWQEIEQQNALKSKAHRYV